MTNEPFHLSVNGQYEFYEQPAAAQQLDIITDEQHDFHILHQGQSYRAEIVAVDYVARQYTLRVNGTKYTVDIADHYERLIQQLGLGTANAQKLNTVKAPMPGLVLSILVTPGQSVQKGDALLILEAMKMENVLKAAGDGIVKAIAVQQGAPVEKGQLLVEME